MNTLKIEWKHLDVEGETCNRCYDTGENLNQEVKRLNRFLRPQGIEVEWLRQNLMVPRFLNQIPYFLMEFLLKIS